MSKSSTSIEFERETNDLIYVNWRIRKIAIEGGVNARTAFWFLSRFVRLAEMIF